MIQDRVPIESEFNEEQQERYDVIKEQTTRLYPSILKDSIQMEMSEHLFRYYAINGKIPEIGSPDSAVPTSN
jgi:hypothetical protein